MKFAKKNQTRKTNIEKFNKFKFKSDSKKLKSSNRKSDFNIEFNEKSSLVSIKKSNNKDNQDLNKIQKVLKKKKIFKSNDNDEESLNEIENNYDDAGIEDNDSENDFQDEDNDDDIYENKGNCEENDKFDDEDDFDEEDQTEDKFNIKGKNKIKQDISLKEEYDDEDDEEDEEDEEFDYDDYDEEEYDEEEEINDLNCDDEIEDEDYTINRNLLKKVKINDQKIKEWSEKLSSDPNKQLLTEIVSSLKIAVICISGKSNKIKAEAATYFNPLLKLVLIDFVPSLHQVLKVKAPSDESELRAIYPKKSKYWKKFASVVKVYLKIMLDIIDNFSDNSVLITLLKHILDLVPFYLCFIPLIKRLLKQTSIFWSERNEEIRVLSFLILLRMLRTQKSEMMSFIMKKLYISYIKNCKFTNEQNFPMINFMKQSLVELYSLDQSVTYQHAFIFIRQCAINLRTLMMSKKKEEYKIVYNWQFIHCLLLWVQTITCLYPSEILKPLIFPLTQVILGTIKLIPSSRFVPLRFHLIRALIKLSSSTSTFIPILPYIVEVLDILERTKKFKIEQQPVDKVNFNILLKVPLGFVDNEQFANLCIENVYELTLEYTASMSHSIAFPELVLASNIRIKKFIKTWNVVNDCKLLKQLLDKINESAKLIDTRRKNITFNISEADKVNSFEQEIKSNTPLTKYLNEYKLDKKNQQNQDKSRKENLKKSQSLNTNQNKQNKVFKVRKVNLKKKNKKIFFKKSS